MGPHAVLLVLALAAPRPMNFRVTEKADRVAVGFVVQLKLDVQYVFETRNLTRGSDTVLVILDDVKPLDWNDDRPRKRTDRHDPYESRLLFTPRRLAPYTIQVRAKDGTLEGQCDLYMNGKLLGKKLKFGAPWKRAKRQPMPMPHPEKGALEPEAELYELPRTSRSPGWQGGRSR